MISNRFIAETLSGAVEELEKERAKRHEQQKKCRERACRSRAAREAAMKSYLGERAYSRLCETAGLILFTWESHRGGRLTMKKWEVQA